MNPVLVACLVVSIVVGASVAALLLAAGWGWFAALLGYSFTGSMALVTGALAVQPGDPRPAPVLALPAPPRNAPAPA